MVVLLEFPPGLLVLNMVCLVVRKAARISVAYLFVAVYTLTSACVPRPSTCICATRQAIAYAHRGRVVNAVLGGAREGL